jgi:hypothetical protein
MGIITLAGPPLSIEGKVFRYVGMADECSQCGLKDICHKLKPGRRYRVVKVRKITHPCMVHLDDMVTVVEVEELPMEASIPQRKALEAALVTLDEQECPYRWCENHALCVLPEDLKGKKVSIKEIKEALDCPRDLRLKRSIIEPK